MAKKYSVKFWIIFWLISAIFLTGWFFYWQTRNAGNLKMETAMNLLPVSEEKREEYSSVLSLADYFLKNDDQEKVFLVLFQNNMEIRPGGGFIGSFGILKIKNGKITSLETHDTGNFDGRIPDTVPSPYPMKETLRVNFLKLRDSNYSPDFTVNAQKAVEFYKMGKGEEKFDGVVGITTNVLTSLLKVTGPITLEGYPGTYSDENAIIALEYQVEKAFDEQGIPRGERKSVIMALAKAIAERVENLSAGEKITMAKIVLEDLKKKDILLNFTDTSVQQSVENSNWAGKVDQDWNKDFLMLVDANFGSYKSDYYVKRSIDYSVDLTKDIPEAVLKITYNHTAKQKDWMTKDYQDYMRVYAPTGSWLNTYPTELKNPQFAQDLGKKYFGFLINVPVGTQKTFEFRYTLPAEIKNDYDLKIQKQAGINDVPVAVHVIYPDGNKKDYEFLLNSDTVLSELEK
jgi:hypothetical protein